MLGGRRWTPTSLIPTVSQLVSRTRTRLRRYRACRSPGREYAALSLRPAAKVTRLSRFSLERFCLQKHSELATIVGVILSDLSRLVLSQSIIRNGVSFTMPLLRLQMRLMPPDPSSRPDDRIPCQDDLLRDRRPSDGAAHVFSKSSCRLSFDSASPFERVPQTVLLPAPPHACPPPSVGKASRNASRDALRKSVPCLLSKMPLFRCLSMFAMST